MKKNANILFERVQVIRMRNIFFSIFLFLFLTGTASAFSDDADHYSNSDISTVWSLTGDSDCVLIAANDKQGIPTDHDIRFCRYTPGTNYLTLREPIEYNYISFILTENCGIWHASDDYDYIHFYYLDSNGGTVAIVRMLSGDFSHPTTTPVKFELINFGSYIQVYRDGTLIKSIAKNYAYEGDTITFRMKMYIAGRYNGGGIQFDDFTTGHIIGTASFITEAHPTLAFTWSEALMRSYTDSEHIVSLYSLTNPDNAGLIKTWTIPSGDDATTTEHGYATYNRSQVIGTNFGLYMYELTRDGDSLATSFFYYNSLSNPQGFPETLFMGTADVSADIRDAANNGGLISPGGSVYLYAEDGEGTGKYPASFELKNIPYNFRAELKSVYGNELINSSTVTFKSLTNNYFVSVDGKSLSPSRATGVLAFSGNVTDGETVTIGSDVYEFESTGGVTGGNIQVNIGNISQTAENLTTAINTVGLSAVSASVVETPASSSYYYSNIEITNNPGIADYQAKVTIPFETGMSADFSNIRFFDSGVSIPYWIESKTDSVSAVVWIQISAGSDIQCRWGISGETASESSADTVLDLYDEFDGSTLNTDKWSTVGSSECVVSSGYARITGLDGNRLTSKSAIPDNSIINLSFYIESSSAAKYCSISVRDQNYQSYSYSKGYMFTYYVDQASILFESSGSDIVSKDTGDSSSGNTLLTRTISTNGNTIADTNGISISDDTYPSGKVGIGGSKGIPVRLYNISVRKYAATEPTLSVGAVQVSTESAPVTSVHIVSDSTGTASNTIATTETCANAEWGAVTLTGGNDGSTITSDTWSYELTDWTNYTSHVFQFSPDLTQPGVYGYVKDLSTEQPIRDAKVTISNDTSSQIVTTDETGFYYLTEGMAINSAYTISAARSGYLATDKFVISTKASATSRKDLYMDPVASDGSGIYYSPHYVRFVVTDKYLFERYSGANVTISGTNATTTTQMTGADGVCGFLMTESTRYAINTVYGSINQTDYITPTENSYFIILDAVGASLLPTSQFYETCNITITKNEVNSSHATITATYSDTGTGTNSVYFVLGQTYSNNNTLNVMETSDVGTGNMTYTFTVQDYVGEDYVIKAVVDHDSFGDVEKYYGINFPGSALPFKGNMIIALVVLVFFVVAMQWGKADAHMGAVLICGLGWWFYYLDIFEKLGSATNTVIGVGLGLATVYAVLSMINKKRDEGGI